MKSILITLTSLALLSATNHTFAAKKKDDAKASNSPTAASTNPAPAKAEAEKSARPIPMHSRADEVDAGAQTFSQTTKAGKVVKHIVTEKTEIKNGDKAATFADIKTGDTVSGLRLKKNAEGTEYEVVKITKFGPVEKKAKASKSAKAPKTEKTEA